MHAFIFCHFFKYFPISSAKLHRFYSFILELSRRICLIIYEVYELTTSTSKHPDLHFTMTRRIVCFYHATCYMLPHSYPNSSIRYLLNDWVSVPERGKTSLKTARPDLSGVQPTSYPIYRPVYSSCPRSVITVKG